MLTRPWLIWLWVIWTFLHFSVCVAFAIKKEVYFVGVSPSAPLFSFSLIPWSNTSSVTFILWSTCQLRLLFRESSSGFAPNFLNDRSTLLREPMRLSTGLGSLGWKSVGKLYQIQNVSGFSLAKLGLRLPGAKGFSLLYVCESSVSYRAINLPSSRVPSDSLLTWRFWWLHGSGRTALPGARAHEKNTGRLSLAGLCRKWYVTPSEGSEGPGGI